MIMRTGVNSYPTGYENTDLKKIQIRVLITIGYENTNLIIRSK